jgi:hypothetical protein
MGSGALSHRLTDGHVLTAMVHICRKNALNQIGWLQFDNQVIKHWIKKQRVRVVYPISATVTSPQYRRYQDNLPLQPHMPVGVKSSRLAPVWQPITKLLNSTKTRLLSNQGVFSEGVPPPCADGIFLTANFLRCKLQTTCEKSCPCNSYASYGWSLASFGKAFETACMSAHIGRAIVMAL